MIFLSAGVTAVLHIAFLYCMLCVLHQSFKGFNVSCGNRYSVVAIVLYLGSNILCCHLHHY